MPKKLDRVYIRVDARFPSDERYQALPYRVRDHAYLFFQALNGWSRDKLTDGRVPMLMVPVIGREMEHPASKVTAFVEALKDVGLLTVDGNDLVIPKYAKWQQTAEEIDEIREVRRESGRRGGEASGRSRREASASSKREANSNQLLEANAKQTEAETETETETVTTGLRPSVTPRPPFEAVVGESFVGEYEAFLVELNSATGRHFRGDAVSRGLYADRRRDGRSAGELLAAARGVAMSRHHMGLNELQVPLNDPKHVLDSKMLDGLIGLGSGEIGTARPETAEEQRQREIAEWAARTDAKRGLQA